MSMQTNNSDYYKKRTNQLLDSGYPLTVRYVDFSQPKTQTIQLHNHDEIEFIHILQGQAYITCGEDTILASKGDIIFINHDIRHFISPVGHELCSIKSIIAHPTFMLGIGQLELEKKYITPIIHNGIFTYVHIIPADNEYNNYLSYIENVIELQSKQPACYELMTKALMLQLWILIFNHQTASSKQITVKCPSSQDEQRVKQAIEYIHNHYMESVMLDDIANSILVSKSECCRCFKRIMNVTPFEYLMKYRILESSKRMLKKPQESIAEIACAVGFNNTSYYNKIFKKYMGCTPTQYRHSVNYIPIN